MFMELVNDSIENTFTFSELKLMIKIAMLKKKSLMNLKMLAEKVNTQASNPKFVKTINILKEHNIIQIKPYFSNTKIVEIDNKKLTDLIDEQYITNIFFGYFKEWHVVTW
jgi:hypothetical protein